MDGHALSPRPDVRQEAPIVVLVEGIDAVDATRLVGQDILEQPGRGAALEAADLERAQTGLALEAGHPALPACDVVREPVAGESVVHCRRPFQRPASAS